MFTFGILSSHLPYVAFVAFYLFYFLFPSQFKQPDDNSLKIGDEKPICIDASNQPEKIQQSADFYFHSDTEKQESQVSVTPEYYSITQIPVLNNNQGSGIRFYSPLFSRPPPGL